MSSASMTSSETSSCSRAAGSVRSAIHRRFSSVEQVAPLREPLVIEHRVHSLLPLRSLMREQMTRPDPGAEIQDVRRWNPRLRQPPDQKQLPQVPGIGPVGLRSLLLARQRGRLGRLGQVHLGPCPLELLDHEPPPRCRLQRYLQPLAPEPLLEPTNPRAGAILAREISPLIVFSHSAEICARCWSSPITIDTGPTSDPQPRRDRARRRRPPTGQPMAYREARSVPPIRMAGRAAGTRACVHLMPFDAARRPDHAARTRRRGAPARMSSSCAGAPPKAMHGGQLPTDCCRHARVDGQQRPSGCTATFPQRETHPITIMSPAPQPTEGVVDQDKHGRPRAHEPRIAPAAGACQALRARPYGPPSRVTGRYR